MPKRIKRKPLITKLESSLLTTKGHIPFLLLKSPNRRTLTISLNHDAQVKVYAPLSCSNLFLNQFLKEKEHWIIEKIKSIREKNLTLRKGYFHQEKFLFLGQNYPLDLSISFDTHKDISFDGHRWLLGVPADYKKEKQQKYIKVKLIEWYQNQAKEFLGARVFHYAEKFRLFPKEIIVKGQKRLWGSCHFRKQIIRLNWQLILTPLNVIDYVIVHELIHLLIPNHSKNFWNKVHEFYPEYKQARQWFKDHAVELFFP